MSHKSKKNRLSARTSLRFEMLESRSLLSGNSHFMAAPTMADSHPAQLSDESPGSAERHKEVRHSSADSSSEHESETKLTATLAPPVGTIDGTGSVKYKSETEHGVAKSSLVVNVQGAAVNSKLDVRIDGVSVGTLATDAQGNGTLKLKSNLPPINAGTKPSIVTVGTLSGTLMADSSEHEAETKLTATLTPPAGTTDGTGSVKYKSETEHGVAKSSLVVNVQGAAVNSKLDVKIDGVSVGTLATDAQGKGTLKLTSNLPPVNAGTKPSVVTVGTLSGTLVTDSNSDKDSGSSSQGESETKLTATLAPPAGTTDGTGSVKYKSETEHGVAKSSLVINVQGAAVNSKLDVRIDGVSVGTLATDTKGKGTLKLTSNLPPVNAGTKPSVVTVGTLSGTLMSVSSHKSYRHR